MFTMMLFERRHMNSAEGDVTTASIAAPDKLKLFVSYSRADVAVADSLVTLLEAKKFTVFIDRRDLPYGEKWQQVLYEYIRDSDTVLFLVSERSIGSKWVQWELQQVTDLKKRLVPVVISRCRTEDLPPAIASIELLPREGAFVLGTHASALVQTLESNRAWVMEATKLYSRTLDWIKADKRSALLLRGTALHNAEQWRASKPNKEVISGDVLDFLLSSRQRANRWLRNSVIGSLMIAAAMLVLAVLAYANSVHATQAAAEAQRQANAATAQSAALTSLSSNNDPQRGLLLAHEALLKSDGKPAVTTVAALRNAVFRFGPAPLLEAGRRGLQIYDVVDGYAPFREQMVKAVNLSANRRWAIASVETADIRELWRLDLEDKDPASTMGTIDIGLIGTTTGILGFAISNTGRRIAEVRDRFGPGVYVFDLNENGGYRAQIAKWPGKIPDHFVSCLFSDNDQFLLCETYLWRLDEQADETNGVVLSPDSDRVSSTFFTKDSKLVGLGSAEGNRFKVRSWKLPGAKEMPSRWFPSDVAAKIAFPDLALPGARGDQEREIYSADGRWQISWFRRRYDGQFITTSPPVVTNFDGAGNRKYQWTVLPEQQTGNAYADNPDQGAVRDAAFSTDGRRLVTIGKTLLVWDLTADKPLSRPLVNLSTEGNHVVIDDSGRWVASFGKQLQVWDLGLEVPAAFPINGTSLLEKDVSIDPDEVDMRFAAAGKWLLVTSHRIGDEFTEFWDLRFANPEGDGNLVRRNLSQAEWSSFFERTQYHKTFPDQPTNGEAMAAADSLGRAGNKKEAVQAYRKIVASEPGVKLEPERRAAQLGAAFFWQKGEQEASSGKYASGLKLLRQAKEMNPAIPWDAQARAGQLAARQWESITRQLGAPRESSDPKTINAYALLGDLRNIMLRYPKARFDAGEHNSNLPAGSGLYEYGLQQLADRTRATANAGDFLEALRLRAVLAREPSADLPSEDQLRQISTKAVNAQFQASLVDDRYSIAPGVVQKATAIDEDLAGRMKRALEFVLAFEVLNRARHSGDRDKLSTEIPNFVKIADKVLGRADAAVTLAVIPPQALNSICWNGATQYGLAKVILPTCEAAVARDNKPQYLDSRGVAYAAVGSFAAAISDFEVYLTKGGPNPTERVSRTQWVEALTKCKSDLTCKNPFADLAFLRSIQ
jgi:WD40 repeat protein